MTVNWGTITAAQARRLIPNPTKGIEIMAYGDKTDYRKIDIYVQVGRSDGYTYKGTTTWAATLKEARERYCLAYGYKPEQVNCQFGARA